MQFNYSTVDGRGFENDIRVDARCDTCGNYYSLLLIVGKEDALNKENEIGRQLNRNGYISFEECGVCNE